MKSPLWILVVICPLCFFVSAELASRHLHHKEEIHFNRIVITTPGKNVFSAGYGAFHEYESDGMWVRVEAVGYDSFEDAVMDLCDDLYRNGYRLPKWWEIDRRATEFIPDWLESRMTTLEARKYPAMWRPE